MTKDELREKFMRYCVTPTINEYQEIFAHVIKSILLIGLLSVGAIFSCKKGGVDPLTNTQKMAGMHSWSGTYYNNGITYKVAYTWEVVIVDNKTIFLTDSLGRISDTLLYTNNNDNTLLFERKYSYIDEDKATTVRYNYSTDILVYQLLNSSKNGVKEINLTAH